MIHLAVISLIWGLSFSLSKMALGLLSPLALAGCRLFLGFGALVVLVKNVRSQWSLKPSVLLGVFQFGLMYALYISSLTFIPSGAVAMLTLLTPVTMYLLGFLFAQVPLSSVGASAVALSVAGGILSVPGDVFLQAAQRENWVTGVGLVLLSNLSFSVGNLLIHREKREWHEGNTAWAQLVGAIVVCIIMVVKGDSQVIVGQFEWRKFWPIIYLGAVPTGLGFYLWNRGVRLAGLTAAGVFSNLKGPVALIFGWLLLDEKISARALWGAAMIFFSAVLVGRASSRKTKI